MTTLNQIKMRIVFNFFRDFMRDLIARISPYCLQKILKQWIFVQKIIEKFDEYFLKFYIKIFIITLNLSCAHIIQKKFKIINKLLLNDVHLHWRFKKFEFLYIESFENFDSNSSIIDFDRSFVNNENYNSTFSIMNELLRKLSNRIESLIVVANSDSKKDDLMNVNESQTNKFKNRFKNS